ncbi:MAG TPA: hypothetical protein P5114_11955, partial [Hyphomicrobiaceae bacterium]|nr:hypothetical protein [Hyphomicrobiaceae bacterium]
MSQIEPTARLSNRPSPARVIIGPMALIGLCVVVLCTLAASDALAGSKSRHGQRDVIIDPGLDIHRPPQPPPRAPSPGNAEAGSPIHDY